MRNSTGGRAATIGGHARREAATQDRVTWSGLVAVVYTYNRRDLVARSLDGVLGQSVAPERVILVDNGSTDGTLAHLATLGLLDPARVEVVRLARNTGAAGGMHAGLARALAGGYAWVWVMDDDVIPAPETLARLKEAYEDCFGDPSLLSFLASRLVDAAGRDNNVPQVDERRDPVTRCASWMQLLDRGLVRVRIATMSSILLPRATLERLGAPRRDFRIWGEDTDFTLRATMWRPGYLVGGSIAAHLRAVPGDLEILGETDPDRIRDFYYLYRNTMYLRRTYWPLHGLLLFLGKAALHLGAALVRRGPRLARARAILAGSLAGLVFRPRHDPLGDPVGAAVAADGKNVAGIAPTR